MHFYYLKGLLGFVTISCLSELPSLYAEDPTLTTTVRIQNVATLEYLSQSSRKTEVDPGVLISSRNTWKVNWGKGNRNGTLIEGQQNPGPPDMYLAKNATGVSLTNRTGANEWVFVPVYIPAEYVNYYLLKVVPINSDECIQFDDDMTAQLNVTLEKCDNIVTDTSRNKQLFKILM